MIVFPIAKINLGLHITAKREDGYHDIETIFYPIMLCDALEFVISENAGKNDSLIATGIPAGSNTNDNLVIKAAIKLREKYSFPALKIHLHKAIPVGAGLGGGSSDSAFFLKTINKNFGLNIPDEELKRISLEIGSDCPFFIDSIPAFATGRGEILKPIDPVLKDYYLVLLNPGVMINTREAYLNCRPHIPPVSLSSLIDHPVKEWNELIINDFENFAINKHPVIGEIKKELYKSGAILSLMSGSGSSVYGIFSRKPELPANLRRYKIYEGFM
jgi:4-diphosphocytidyl-2-C-methyl-D-erythritol kinase